MDAAEFIIINRKLAKRIGMHAACLVAELYSCRERFGEEFHIQQELLAESLMFSLRRIQRLTAQLVKLGFIEVFRRDMPAKNYYRINDDVIVKYANE